MKTLVFWKVRTTPQRGDLVGLEAVQRGAAIARCVPPAGSMIAGDGVEGRGLAGAVGADQRQHLALAHLEAQRRRRRQAAEADRRDRRPTSSMPVACRSSGGLGGWLRRTLAAAGTRAALRHQLRTAGTMPSGRK